MTIHHATVKRAATSGIILTEMDVNGETLAQAHWAEGNMRFTHSDPKVALDAALLGKTFRTEYPALTLQQEGEEFFVITTNPDEPEDVILGTLLLPALADVLEAAAELGIDPEEGFEEDAPSVVVPAKYKERYREAGNPDNCGDELAEFLDGKFINGDLKFDLDGFIDFCADNNTAPSAKLDAMIEKASRGYVGRARMNLRQKLELEITRVGFVKYNGRTHHFSKEFLDMLAEKHTKITPEWS